MQIEAARPVMRQDRGAERDIGFLADMHAGRIGLVEFGGHREARGGMDIHAPDLGEPEPANLDQAPLQPDERVQAPLRGFVHAKRPGRVIIARRTIVRSAATTKAEGRGCPA